MFIFEDLKIKVNSFLVYSYSISIFLIIQYSYLLMDIGPALVGGLDNSFYNWLSALPQHTQESIIYILH